MQAIRWHARHDVRHETVDLPPPPRADEVQVRVLWCGICGTDIEEWRHGPIFIPVDQPDPLTGAHAPLVLGHEVTGEVVALGSAVTTLAVGDRVAIDGLSSCGLCTWCRQNRTVLCPSLSAIGLMSDGGLAEFCNAPARGCFPIPDSLPSDEAALAETLAVGVRALRRGRLHSADRVLVIGAGAVGLLTMQAALAGGAAEVHVVEPHVSRRDLAKALGASAVYADTAALRGVEADLVLECSGRPAGVSDGIALARRGGRVVLVGLYAEAASIDATRVVTRELDVIGALSHVHDEDFVSAVELLGSGSVKAGPLITDRVPITDALAAFESLATNPAEHLKILVSPSA